MFHCKVKLLWPPWVVVDFLVLVNVQPTIMPKLTFQLHYVSPELPVKSVVRFHCHSVYIYTSGKKKLCNLKIGIKLTPLNILA